jgi:hypothetical protein
MIYDVILIPQSTNMSCWAASIAMILSWKNQASFDPQMIASNPGGTNYMPQFANNGPGLDPNDKYILERNGFKLEAPQCYTLEAVQGLLAQHGPLWVASQVPAGPHIRVVTGSTGDRLHINDPSPVNQGAKYTRGFNDFFGQMETLGGQELNEPSPVYVAYLG